MTHIINISENDFNNTEINIAGFVIVECHNGSAGSLQIMEPVFAKLRKRINIEFTHLRVNTQQHSFIKELYHTTQDLNYLFFHNGKFIDRAEGMISIYEFENRINNNLKSNNHE